MTKVPWHVGFRCLLTLSLLSGISLAQTIPADSNCPQTISDLYSQLRTVSLDANRVYYVRGATIDRSNMHIDFDDGTLAFLKDVCGRTTGALFEGEGEVRLRPSNKVERASMALFTGMAILEEQFTSGYIRFNDDTAAKLQPYLTPAPEAGDFVARWTEADSNLAGSDTLRLLFDFSQFLPATDGSHFTGEFPRFLHAHLLGHTMGSFDLFWDDAALETLWAGQARVNEGNVFFDTWTAFSPNTPGSGEQRQRVTPGEASTTGFRIRATITPPTDLKASATVEVQIRRGGQRMLLFELSRFLKIESVQENGRSLEFIQNQSLQGTDISRKGDDLVSVVFPAPLKIGEKLDLVFRYEGEVLSEAGPGLLYVGARGTWYPSFGLSPARFDLEFRYPAGWTLVATGKQQPPSVAAGEEKTSDAAQQVSRWVAEKPIPVAGFNLGKYIHAEARSGSVVVEAFGTMGVEKSFPKPPPETVAVIPTRPFPIPMPQMQIEMAPPPPSPAHNAQAVAERAAGAVSNFSQWFGPYPFSSLSLTQMPGKLSQGWPGLVFLSTYAFLSPQEQADLHLSPSTALLANLVLPHETAHQWWGNLVLWKSYRDQWLIEGLADYSSLMVLERQNPAQFRQVLDKYRADLLTKNKDGELLREAGPVTLGTRLTSSHFPGAYETITYERGAWLFHMLRCMLRDSDSARHPAKSRLNSPDPFLSGLRKLSERYAGKAVTTRDVLQVFEEELPRALWFEGRRSLDWFLDSWINGTAVPRLEASEIKITPTVNGAQVSGIVVQKDAPDDLVTAVPVYAVTAGNAKVFLGQVLADGDETSFRFAAPAGTRKVVLDPNQTILTAQK